jgi:hypothetical protein
MVKFPFLPALLVASSLAATEPPGSPQKAREEKAADAEPAGQPAKPGSPARSGAAPAETSGTQPAPAPAIKSLGGTRHELNGIQFDRKTRAISLPAKINMTEGLLEYALVHEAGKVHESLLSTAVSPFDLNVVLLLVNYQPSGTFFDLSDKKAGAVLVKNPKIESQAKLTVTLEWKDPDGQPKAASLESLLLNIDQKAPAKEGPFIYTGSMLMEDGTFMAKDTGSILALYADAAALINNPREGNENDDAWICDPKKVPAKETAVTVTLTPAK